MEEEMKELYVEGLATHGGPESCVDDPRGRGEALTGVRAGRAIEPRNRASSLAIMPVFGIAKRRLGERLGSGATAGKVPRT
jgi:hypothetical protein